MENALAGQGPMPGGTPPGLPGAAPGMQTPPPMPGAMSGIMPPPPGAGAPGALPGLAAALFQDLPPDMPPHYQLLDIAERQIKTAINTGGFYKQPAELAAVRHISEQLGKIIANYGRPVSSGGAGEAPAKLPEVSEVEAGGEPATEAGGE